MVRLLLSCDVSFICCLTKHRRRLYVTLLVVSIPANIISEFLTIHPVNGGGLLFLSNAVKFGEVAPLMTLFSPVVSGYVVHALIRFILPSSGFERCSFVCSLLFPRVAYHRVCYSIQCGCRIIKSYPFYPVHQHIVCGRNIGWLVFPLLELIILQLPADIPVSFSAVFLDENRSQN